MLSGQSASITNTLEDRGLLSCAIIAIAQARCIPSAMQTSPFGRRVAVRVVSGSLKLFAISRMYQ